MKNKNIIILIIINIILTILLNIINKNKYIIILIEILLYLVYYIYLLIKEKNINKNIIITNVIMCFINIIITYVINGNIDFIINEDLSNIEELFSIFSFIMINILYSFIFIVTDVIKLLISKSIK